MRSAVALVCMAILCSGCTVTFTGTSKWSDVVDNGKLQMQYDKLATDARNLVTELKDSPYEIDAVSAVLKKYGVMLKQE